MAGANITIEGTGNDEGEGVQLGSGPEVTASGSSGDAATITIDGIGGTGTNFNLGVDPVGANTQVFSAAGAVAVTGTGK